MLKQQLQHILLKNCYAYLFRATLCKVMFVLHKDVPLCNIDIYVSILGMLKIIGKNQGFLTEGEGSAKSTL